MYVHSHLGNDGGMASLPQAGLHKCSVPCTRWSLQEFMCGSSEGVRVSVSPFPAAGSLWLIEHPGGSCGILTSQSFRGQGQPQRVAMPIPFRSGYSESWQGKALIRKTSRSHFTPGCFDRAVTVYPQAGSSGWNIEQKNILSDVQDK